MGRIALQRQLRSTLAVLAGVLCAGMVLTATANAKTLKWNLTKDFAKHLTSNPAPDKYGHPSVWSWMYGEPNKPGTYTLGSYVSPATNMANCGPKVKGLTLWGKGGGTPNVVYN